MNLLARFAILVAAAGITAGLSAQTIDIRHTAPDNRRMATAWISAVPAK